MGGISNPYKIFVGKPERKRPRGSPRRRGDDNIRVDLREIGLEGVDECIWLRIGNNGDSCEYSNESYGGGEFLD
jgi:hypothetical protein